MKRLRKAGLKGFIHEGVRCHKGKGEGGQTKREGEAKVKRKLRYSDSSV